MCQVSHQTDKIGNLDQICPKRAFPVENEKSEQHHLILRIRISVGIKFHLKPTILIFRIKFSQKGYFLSKAKKVNSMIELCIFELV